MSSPLTRIATAGVLLIGFASCSYGEPGPTTPIAGCANLARYATCSATPFSGPFAPRAAHVLLAVERSERLLRVLPGATNDVWTEMTTGLAAALTQSWSNVDFAMLAYPSGVSTGCGAGCCTVLAADSAVRGPFEPGTAARIYELLLSDHAEGEAPMGAALATAQEYLTELDVPASGDAFVVLLAGGVADCGAATTCDTAACVPNLEMRCTTSDNCCDGAPSLCNDTASTGERIDALAARGIATLVVKLAGTVDPADALDDLARRGGRPSPATGGAYTVGATAPEIQDAMAGIFGHLGARCQAPLPGGTAPQPGTGAAATVVSGCAVLAPGELRADSTGTYVVLEPDSCTAIASAPASQPLSVLSGCRTAGQ